MFHKNFKIIFIFSLLSFGLMVQLKAQDKYHMAKVSYASYNKVKVLTDFKPTEEISMDSIGVSDRDVALLKVTTRLSEEGWEVINVAYTGGEILPVYFLRKKF